MDSQMMNDLMKQEEKIYFDQIVKLTEKGTINWECTEYNPIGFLGKDSFSEQSACITQMFNFTTIAGGFLHELELAEYVYVPSGKIDICATLTREDEKHFLKIDSFLSIELDQQNDTEPMDINKVSVVRLAKYLIPIAVETASVSEAFEWARYFNEKDISRTLRSNPLTRLGERLCSEHRALDFHRIVLDSVYRNELLAQI